MSASEEQPADVLTRRSVVLLQNRPVVGLGQWLLAAHALARSSERRLVVVTPEHSVLTLSVARLLDQFGGLWAVDAGGVTFDGRSGRVLAWRDGAFDTSADVHPGFAPYADDGWALHVLAETRHPYDDEARVGRLTEAAFEAAGLGPVLGVGVAEPAERPWSRDHVTAVARESSPDPAMLSAVAARADGLVTAVPTPDGVDELVEVLGATDDGPDPDAFATGLLAAGAGLAVLGHRRAVAGRFAPARVTGPTVPAVLALARARVPALTDDELLAAGGPGARLVRDPVPALVVTYPGGTPGPMDDARAAAVEQHRATLDLLAAHDARTGRPTLR